MRASERARLSCVVTSADKCCVRCVVLPLLLLLTPPLPPPPAPRRYDDNINFVKSRLLPLIESYRDAVATGAPLPHTQSSPLLSTPSVLSFDPNWKERFHLNLSFADGSPARTYAIQASLRPYRPTYMHFWQLKTYWHSDKVCEDDVEVHSFEDMEVEPPCEVEECDTITRMVVEEMKRFRNEFREVEELGIDGSDLRQFWLRKSKKPVLAILLARGKNGELELFRGTNLEVSMPTGSLCAERNVIGTALANNVGLKRGDLLAVAVLAANMDGHKPAQVEVLASSVLCPTIPSPPPSPRHPSSPSRKISVRKYSDEGFSDTDGSSVHPTHRRRTQKTIYAAHGDINPLKPCGSCNEWLKKIAEPNPKFKVITFTNEKCEGVYTNSIAFE